MLIYTYRMPRAGPPEKRQVRWHPATEKFLVREIRGKDIVSQATCDRDDLPRWLADDAVSRSSMAPTAVALSYLDWPW